MVRTRDVIAAGTVWLPLVVGLVAWLRWRDELPVEVMLRNDLDGAVAPIFPMWAILVPMLVVLIGVGVGAASVVPLSPNEAGNNRRIPLFWSGAVAGFATAVCVFQMWVAVSPPVADPSRANALLGFATIGCALYGLVPFFIAHRAERMPVASSSAHANSGSD